MDEHNQGPQFFGPGTTGRTLVALARDQVDAGVNALSDIARVSIESAEGGEIAAAQLESPEASVVFPTLGVAVVPASPEQFMGIRAAEADPSIPILATAPEKIVFAAQENPLDEEERARSEEQGEETLASELAEEDTTLASEFTSPNGLSMEYLRGYSDAVQTLRERVVAGEALVELEELTPAAINEAQSTWGLQLTKTDTSQFSGRGIKVAVLDTGLDVGHPDFAGRSITTNSFVPNQPVQDGHGHGTHCIGTACGPQRPSTLPRYGIAYAADIFAGKVLSNGGSGTDGQMLGGIEWAIANGCEIISMSIQRRVQPGEKPDPVFDEAGRRALEQGTLIIACAGNFSSRPLHIDPVTHPANCDSIMAVGALDERLQVAPFSCGGLIRPGGVVDIAAPGVNVYSSVPRPQLYDRMNGTSMATPHVAGIAALYAELNPNFRGLKLARQLRRSALKLPLPKGDVGTGLVQAP
jgi:subtilisin family serine protease